MTESPADSQIAGRLHMLLRAQVLRASAEFQENMDAADALTTPRGVPVMATRRRRPRRTLTPVRVTARSPSFTTGRVETWSAVSTDGVWEYERIEDTGTPWEIRHVPSGTTGSWYGSLPAARAATADGSALAYVKRIQAHNRGEHATERDVRCGRCLPCQPTAST